MADRGLRILIAADVPEDPNSGAAGSEYQGARALRGLGHHVDTCWASSFPHRIGHANLHSVFELTRSYDDLLLRASERHYDVYQFNQVFAQRAARAHKERRLEGVFVTRSHGFEANALATLDLWHGRLGTRARRWATRLPGMAIDSLIRRASEQAARWSDGLLVSSPEDQDFITKRYGVPPDRVAAIPQAPPPEYQAAPPAAFTGERSRRLLFIGPLRIWKGVHVLRAVLASLLAGEEAATATLVLPADDLEGAASLVGPELRKRVHLRGPMSQAELMTAYDAHGILLFPSLFEGFGKVVVEAMSRGMCVVGSRLGAARLAIEDGRTGRLVTPGDVGEFEQAARALLREPDRVMEMGRASREAVVHLTWERFAQESVHFYRHLLERRRRRTGEFP